MIWLLCVTHTHFIAAKISDYFLYRQIPTTFLQVAGICSHVVSIERVSSCYTRLFCSKSGKS